jgi:hypothetical protein
MVATRSASAAPWARTLARLAGHVRCLKCDRVWKIADAAGERAGAEPVDVIGDHQSRHAGLQGVLFQMGQDDDAGSRRFQGVPSATVADAVAGFQPAPGRKLRSPQVLIRTLWRAGGAAVDALTPVPGRPAVVAAGSSDGVRLREMASGSLAGPLLPDGGAVIAAAGKDGSLRWWDASTSRPLDGAVTAGAAPVLSLAPVLVSPGPIPQVASWLAGLSDGPAVLAAGSADGAVRLWDPVTRALPRQLGYRQPVLLADRNGTVSMWETFGVRLSDPLPPDPAHLSASSRAACSVPATHW